MQNKREGRRIKIRRKNRVKDEEKRKKAKKTRKKN